MRRNRLPTGPTTRTTILFPETVDANLDYFCLCVRKSKSEVVEEAVRRYLQREGGLNPDEMPKLELPKESSGKK